MKNQMITLVIGILLGAIIATGVFLVLKSSDSKSNRMPSMGNRPEINDKNFPSKDNSNSNNTTENKS